MQPKVILGPAWAEREGMSVSDIASLLAYDLASAVPAGGEDDTCPRCGNHPPDSEFQFFDESAMSTPERVPGRGYVRCLCGTDYHYASVHEVDVRQPLGRIAVRAASASNPVVPLLTSWAPVVDEAIPRRPSWHHHPGHYAAYYADHGSNAAVIWNRVAKTAHLRQNQAND